MTYGTVKAVKSHNVLAAPISLRLGVLLSLSPAVSANLVEYLATDTVTLYLTPGLKHKRENGFTVPLASLP